MRDVEEAHLGSGQEAVEDGADDFRGPQRLLRPDLKEKGQLRIGRIEGRKLLLRVEDVLERKRARLEAHVLLEVERTAAAAALAEVELLAPALEAVAHQRVIHVVVAAGEISLAQRARE